MAQTLRRFAAEPDPAALDEGPELVVSTCLRLGVETCQSAELLLRRRLFVNAISTSRGFIELSLRCMWASRAPDGWDRLRGYYARREIDQARKMAAAFDQPEARYTILGHAEASRLAELRPRMPDDLASVLRDIESHNKDEGLAHLPHQQHYRAQFVPMHSAAHGSPTVVYSTFDQPTFWNLEVYIACAAVDAIRAAFALFDWEWKTTETEISGLLRAAIEHARLHPPTPNGSST
jgi:hypothetical protein